MTEQKTATTIELIDRPEVCKEMGGMSRSRSYTDPDINALAIPMTDGERIVWRWAKHEIYELIAKRIALRDQQAEARRAEALARRERDLARKRVTPPRNEQAQAARDRERDLARKRLTPAPRARFRTKPQGEAAMK